MTLMMARLYQHCPFTVESLKDGRLLDARRTDVVIFIEKTFSLMMLSSRRGVFLLFIMVL